MIHVYSEDKDLHQLICANVRQLTKRGSVMVDTAGCLAKFGVLPEQMGSLEDPVVVDVRPAQERKVSWIPGSIDKETFEAHPEQYRDRPVVTYCTIGARSGVYAKKLQNDGWDVRNLHGSLLLWTHAGLPLENAEGPTKTVHTYGKQWALVAEGYTAVW